MQQGVGQTSGLSPAQVSRMFAIAEVYETDIGRVRVGQRARVTSPALAGVLANVAARPLARISELIDRISEGASEAELPPAPPDSELAAIQSKLTLLGGQARGPTQVDQMLERLQALMRSSVPDGDLGAIIEAAVTEKLERLVSLESPSNERAAVNAAGDYLARAFGELDAEVERLVYGPIGPVHRRPGPDCQGNLLTLTHRSPSSLHRPSRATS